MPSLARPSLVSMNVSINRRIDFLAKSQYIRQTTPCQNKAGGETEKGWSDEILAPPEASRWCRSDNRRHRLRSIRSIRSWYLQHHLLPERWFVLCGRQRSCALRLELAHHLQLSFAMGYLHLWWR